MKPSAKFLLADTLLGGRLVDLLRERKDAGDSWDAIAREVYVATEHTVSITGVTAQSWFARYVDGSELDGAA